MQCLFWRAARSVAVAELSGAWGKARRRWQSTALQQGRGTLQMLVAVDFRQGYGQTSSAPTGSHDIQNRKQEDPNDIDEVPVQACALEESMFLRRNMP